MSLLQGAERPGDAPHRLPRRRSALGKGELEARALTFATLVVANLGLILVNRSWTRSLVKMLRAPNAALWWVIGAALALLGLVLFVPALRDLFRVALLHADDLALVLVTGLASVAWFEISEAGLEPAAAGGACASRQVRGVAGRTSSLTPGRTRSPG